MKPWPQAEFLASLVFTLSYPCTVQVRRRHSPHPRHDPLRHNEQRLRLRCCRRCRRRCNLRHRRRCHYHRRTAAFAFAATFSSLYLVDCCLFPPAGAVAAVVFIVAAVVVTIAVAVATATAALAVLFSAVPSPLPSPSPPPLLRSNYSNPPPSLPLVCEWILANISTVGIRSCFYVWGGRYASLATMIFLVAINTVLYVLCTQFHTPAGYEGTIRKKRCLWTGPKATIDMWAVVVGWYFKPGIGRNPSSPVSVCKGTVSYDHRTYISPYPHFFVSQPEQRNV